MSRSGTTINFDGIQANMEASMCSTFRANKSGFPILFCTTSNHLRAWMFSLLSSRTIYVQQKKKEQNTILTSSSHIFRSVYFDMNFVYIILSIIYDLSSFFSHQPPFTHIHLVSSVI